MPELPEIETLRGDLHREVASKKIKAVTVDNGRWVGRHKTAKAYRDLLEGRTIKAAERLGTSLLFPLDSGNTLVLDLGNSGQLQRAKTAKVAKAKHTHIVITLNQGGELRFISSGTDGGSYVSVPLDEAGQSTLTLADSVIHAEARALRRRVSELHTLGFDPVESMLTWEQFGYFLHREPVRLKDFLIDQSTIVGIGDVYSDEILFAAGLRYDRLSSSLSTTEVRRLYRALVEILAEATKHRGSTLADGLFVDLDGKPGSYQQFHEVYERAGEACRRCRSVVTKVKWRDRGTYGCQQCQI
jgi:formamidopyrimidine-DNA glycosylase